MPKTDTTKLLVGQAVSQLRATAAALAALRQEMQSLAASLPEYPVVMQMFGVGTTLGPQLMAEIGDVRRFHSKFRHGSHLLPRTIMTKGRQPLVTLYKGLMKKFTKSKPATS
jgi:transposase